MKFVVKNYVLRELHEGIIREISVICSEKKEIYCTFADKNVTLSHNSVKY